MASFRIPIASLKAEEASFQWQIGPDFFLLFDDQHEAEKGFFEVSLLSQHTGSVTTLEFTISGAIETSCDRCTAQISLPIAGNYEILVKFGDPAETTDEVIFIDPESNGLNVGQHLYDFIMLSIPISRKIPDCETSPDPPCDMTVLSYLEEINKTQGDSDSLWDDLKKVTDN